MHIYVIYIREINEDTTGGKKTAEKSGNLCIYIPRCDKQYEAKHAMFVYFCYFVMESEKSVVTIVKQ